MGFLSGKRILVTGVASKLSIAYGIAQAMHREGAELAFTYQNDKLKGRVEEFAAQLGSDIVLQCDVAEDASIDTMFAELAKASAKILTVSYTLLVLHLAINWMVTMLMPLPVKASKLPTTSAPTASLQWQKLPLHAESGFCPADPFLPWR